MPVGLARVAELDRGFDVDVPLLATGALVIFAAVVGLRVFAAWRVRVAAPHPAGARRAVARGAGARSRSGSPSVDMGCVSRSIRGRRVVDTGLDDRARSQRSRSHSSPACGRSR